MARKVLHVIASLRMGGAQSVLAYLLRQWRGQSRYQFAVAAVLPGGPFMPMVAAMGVPVYELGVSVPYDPRAIGRLRDVLRREQPDIIHCHLFYANLYAALANRGAGRRPLLYTEHSIWNRRRAMAIMRSFDRWLAFQFDAVVAVAEIAKQRFVEWTGYPAGRIVVIPNGIAVENYPPVVDIPAQRAVWGLDAGDFAFITVGRLAPPKGLPHLLRAARLLADAGRRFRLLIVGDGPLRAELQDLAGVLKLTPWVTFLGARSDAPVLVTASDAFVLASEWEALPMALLEAMACCKPAVVTRVGAIPEVVRHGEEGLLVPPADPEALAQAMMGLMDMTEGERRHMGLTARRRVEQSYHIRQTAERLLELYDEF
ncbi:MAG: glycosyltransferase [Anaerolineae bacterium]